MGTETEPQTDSDPGLQTGTSSGVTKRLRGARMGLWWGCRHKDGSEASFLPLGTVLRCQLPNLRDPDCKTARPPSVCPAGLGPSRGPNSDLPRLSGAGLWTWTLRMPLAGGAALACGPTGRCRGEG